MKKKVIALLLIAVIACSAFTGCGISNANADDPTEDSNGRDIKFAEPTYKTFSVDEMELKLPDSFQREDVERGTNFYNNDYAVLLTREAFAEYPSLQDMTLEEYGQLLLESSNIDASIEIIDGLHCFEYEAVSASYATKFNYFVVLYKSNQAFWIVQFGSVFWNASPMRSKFISWAKMIEFTD